MTKEQDSMNVSEGRCHRLGDLAARAADERPPDPRQWAEIEQAIEGRPGFWRRRWLVLAIPALAVAGLALWVAGGQTLGYKLQGCSPASDGSLSATDDRTCAVVFEDGTRITLGKATRGRLRGFGRRGAELVLENGHADLSVVHRPGGRWQVLAGPFKVWVTGTRFEVDWAPEPGHFSLGVSDGEVRVSGSPLRGPTPVRAGQRLDVDMATGSVVVGDLGAPAAAAAERAAPAEIRNKMAAGEDAAPTPAARVEHKRGASSGKTGVRSPPLVATLETATTKAESPAATSEPAPRDWTASSAADVGPASAVPGPRRLTIGRNGELVGGATGPVWADRGSGTRFTAPARGSANHLYLDEGSLCTRGRISALTCVDGAFFSRRCDGDTNWGVLIRWYPHEDREAWGDHANSRIAMEFQGESGRYRLFAHREGDPAKRAYCVRQYRSGQTVKPSDFTLDCWTGGPSLPDFTQIDYFALQVPSEETWLTFKLCLSAINLY